MIRKQFVLGLSLFALAGGTVRANELDNENLVTNVRAEDAVGTVVLRVDNVTNETFVHKTDAVIPTDTRAQAVQAGEFLPLPASSVKSELDQDGGASSWYFYYGSSYGRGYYDGYRDGYRAGYSAPYYYSYGYSYRPVYSWNYGRYSYYSYYYDRPCHWGYGRW
jgi:hypothetical protein